MNISSMTGYGKGEATGDQFLVTCEIKTVNNRFKDFRFKMGSLFNSKEMELKKILEAEFKRGSFDIYVNYKKNESQNNFDHLDEVKITTFIKKAQAIGAKTNQVIQINPTDFLRPEFYLERDELVETELNQLLEKAFSEAVLSLKRSRQEEGSKLIQVINEYLNAYKKYYEEIKNHKSGYQEMVREKFLKRFKEEKDLKVDEGRFLQEVLYYLEKLDIDEEISRVQIHLSKVKKIFESGGEVGKQLDFLLQELGRETNTMGSKSQKNEISENVVQMKVQLEKIREQALNLE